MTQRDTIYQMLESGDWICGNDFLKAYIPEYRSRINELRKLKHVIITRRCFSHVHKGITQEWRLTSAIPLPPPITETARLFLLQYGSKERVSQGQLKF